MNGAPAKPMSGVAPSSATVRATASRIGSREPSVSSGRAATSAAVRTGRSRTGPRPGTISTSTPATRMGTTMSEKKMAASTSCRRTGWSVISAAIAGSRQASSMAVPWRRDRYSGSDRPACRMNHTGRRPGARPVRACSSGASSVPAARSGWPCGSAPSDPVRRRNAAEGWVPPVGCPGTAAVDVSGVLAVSGVVGIVLPLCQGTPTSFTDAASPGSGRGRSVTDVSGLSDVTEARIRGDRLV